MKDQDKTKEDVLEEVLKELEEGASEEAATEEVAVDKIVLDEAFEEDVIEEISLEEAMVEVEETAEEEETAGTEETAEAEEESEQAESQNEKKGIRFGKKAKIITASVIAIILVAYIAVALYFSNRFLMGTTVNGTNCTGKTVEEVKSMLQSQVEEYVLTLEEANAQTEEIKGVDIGIKYNGVDVLEGALEEQNSYAWIVSLFKKNPIKAEVDFEYDSVKLDEVIGQLSCLKPESQTAPVSAVPVYVNGTYEIQEEVYGTQIHSENLYASIQASVAAMDGTMNLEENKCYVLPTFTKDSEEVVAARDGLNKCLEANITYSLEGITVTVDKSMIANWISVDANMAVLINAEQVRAFTDTLGTQYNTPNTSEQITTPTGKVSEVPNARLGRVVGSAAECDQLINEIREGKKVTREPLLSQQATPEGATAWGATYVEVDIAAQHMWYIVDGAVAFESDIVTGSPGRDTPIGLFTILEKLSPKVLRGNIVPATGKPEYVTPVKYWARITWSGVGFHDATWQPAFGGELYKQGYGSHGCINMPLNAVAQFYQMIAVGCPVIVHY